MCNSACDSNPIFTSSHRYLDNLIRVWPALIIYNELKLDGSYHSNLIVWLWQTWWSAKCLLHGVSAAENPDNRCQMNFSMEFHHPVGGWENFCAMHDCQWEATYRRCWSVWSVFMLPSCIARFRIRSWIDSTYSREIKVKVNLHLHK